MAQCEQQYRVPPDAFCSQSIYTAWPELQAGADPLTSPAPAVFCNGELLPPPGSIASPQIGGSPRSLWADALLRLSASPVSVTTPDHETFEEDVQDLPEIHSFYHHGGSWPKADAVHVGVRSSPEPQAALLPTSIAQSPPPATFVPESVVPAEASFRYGAKLSVRSIQPQDVERSEKQVPTGTDALEAPNGNTHDWVNFLRDDKFTDDDRFMKWPFLGQTSRISSPFNQDHTTKFPMHVEAEHGFSNWNRWPLPVASLSSASCVHGPTPSLSNQTLDSAPELTPIVYKASSQQESPLLGIRTPSTGATMSRTPSGTSMIIDLSDDPVEHRTRHPEPQGKSKMMSPSAYGPHRANAPTTRKSNPGGGRARGTHLATRVAKEANDMRAIRACWHCIFTRDKCGPGEICDRCLKRALRPTADCGLGCSRVKLVELASAFLPATLERMHEVATLQRFLDVHIARWTDVSVEVSMTCGEKMPILRVGLNEFLPKGNALLTQNQYQIDAGGQYVRVCKASPPLGLVRFDSKATQYDDYVDTIVNDSAHLAAFADLCWASADNDVSAKLFNALGRVRPASLDERRVLHDVRRLVVTTFIMGHVLTLAEDSKLATLAQLRSYTEPAAYTQTFTTPRLANRQLKFFFHRLQGALAVRLLNKLQQIFNSSKGTAHWLSAFLIMLGLSMAFEDQQETMHIVMETRAVTGECDAAAAAPMAEYIARELDDRFSFLAALFRRKYGRKANPLRDASRFDCDWDRELGDGNGAFIQHVASLVRENMDFLSERQHVSISSANREKYSSRLTAQFLLSL